MMALYPCLLSGTYQYFGYSKGTFEGGPSYSGNTQGYTYPSRYIDTIVKPNAQCALDMACISPPGASLSSHRFDQSALSVLAYQYHIRAPHYTEFLAAERRQMNRDLDAESPPLLLWTSRAGESHYARAHGFPALVPVDDVADGDS